MMHLRIICGISRKIAHAQTGTDDLAEGAEEHHPAFLVKALDRGQRIARVTQITRVRVVFGNYNAVFGSQLCNSLAPFQRKRLARGILEGRNDIQQLGMVLLHGLFQGFNNKTVFIAFNRNGLSLIQPHTLDIAEERRIFQQHNVAGIDQRLAKQIHRLCGARHGKYAALRNINADSFAQIGIQLLQ